MWSSLKATAVKAALLFTDPLTVYLLACALFAFLGVTYERLFFVFNVLDIARLIGVLKV